MDSTLTSHTISASVQFSHRPQTPTLNHRKSIRSTFSPDSQRSPSTGTPTKIPRLFNSLKGRNSRRNSRSTIDDGSPKSHGFRKSLAGLFDSVRTFRSPDRSPEKTPEMDPDSVPGSPIVTSMRLRNKSPLRNEAPESKW